jgi:PKD repeat protein
MKYFLSLLALAFSCNGYSQITLVDTPHCLNHTLHAEVTGGIIPISSGITVDDGWSGVIPIGFSYNFYGVGNTQCVIGSNGCLGFNLASAGMYNTWPISTTLAATTATDIRNVICGPWCDVYIPMGGTIKYSTQGIAPNRNFAVTWCGTHMYGCTSEWLTTQIVIYETSGLAEVHLGHRTICATGWNGSRAIIGVKNAAGTVSTSPPTRDFAPTWVATNEAWRFTPVAGPTYTVSAPGAIPYAPIPYAASGIYWYDSATHTYLGAGPDITVNPLVPTTYIACALGCNDTTKAYIHVLPSIVAFGGPPHISTTNITAVNPTVCGKNDGYITLHGITPHNVDSVFWSIGGVAQPIIIDSAHLDSTISFPNLCANTYDYFYYKVGNCPSNQVGPITLTTPPLRADLYYSVDMKCDGDVVSFYNLSTPYTIDYATTWDFGDGSPVSPTLNPVHTYTSQGTYTVHLHYASVYTACTGPCSVDTTFTVALNHPLYDSFVMDYDQICIGMPTTFTNYSTSSTNGASTTSLLKYYWEFSSVGTDSVANPVYTFPSPGMYDVKLTITDTIGCQKVYDDSVMVIYIGVRTRVHDTSVCLTDSMGILSYVELIPDGRVSYSYAWTPTNNIGGRNQFLWRRNVYLYSYGHHTAYGIKPERMFCI